MTQTQVTIYTDGAADPNPGIGGWAAILRAGAHEKFLTGHNPHTTNNQMELTAAVAALETLKRPCEVAFYTDSEYLRRGVTEWMDKWAARGWVHKGGRAIPNVELWQQLWRLTRDHNITWHWVRGHAGDVLNERVDQLARAARLTITPGATVSAESPHLYLRASCLGNPGPGGWGVVLTHQGQTRQLSGHANPTTNNRLEIQAALAALNLLSPGDTAQILTISDYLFQGATRWLPGWRQRQWRKQGGQLIANHDLWQQLDHALTRYHIHWVNAKGQTLPELDAARLLAESAAHSSGSSS